MAVNNQHRYGFRWNTQANGKDCPQPLRKTVPTSNDDADDNAGLVHIYPGDPVKLLAGGGVEVALTTEIVYGIVVGVAPYWSAADGVMKPGKYYPNATAWGTKEERRGYVYVVPAHWGLWEVDAAYTAASPETVSTSYDTEAEYKAIVNKNLEHVVPGSATTGYGHASSADPYVDLSTVADTATLGWRIVDVSQTMENQDFGGAFVKLIVTVNESYYAGMPATGSIVAGA